MASAAKISSSVIDQENNIRSLNNFSSTPQQNQSHFLPAAV
jgi:hypothetical protein